MQKARTVLCKIVRWPRHTLNMLKASESAAIDQTPNYPSGLWIRGLVLFLTGRRSSWSVNIMPLGVFAKATRESAATRATNSEWVSGIHLETLITCSFTAEVVNELLNGLSFFCKR